MVNYDLISLIYIGVLFLIFISILIYMTLQLKKLSKQKKIIEEIENVFDEFVDLLYLDHEFIDGTVNFEIYDYNLRVISKLLEDLLKSYEKYV